MPTEHTADLKPQERKIYLVTLSRVVTTYDEVTRYIAATSQERAQEIAAAEAAAYDNKCPGDCVASENFSYDSWDIEGIDALSDADAAKVATDDIIEDVAMTYEAAAAAQAGALERFGNLRPDLSRIANTANDIEVSRCPHCQKELAMDGECFDEMCDSHKGA